jgi:hypothetical protein
MKHHSHSVAAPRHPDHDRLRDEVRSWYRTSWPQRGYHVEHRRFGFYRRHANHPDSGLIIIETLTADEVPELLADARTYFDNCPVHLAFDDKTLDKTCGPSLVAAGCAIDQANTYLAHVGPPPDRVHLPDVTIEPVTADTLMDYVQTKLKGFANSEAAPSANQIDEELSLRKSEFETIARFLIARVANDPAAVIGHYDGPDRLIFNLATRLPFRMKGLARQLLCGVITDSYDQNCRSIIINTNPDDTPIQWYTRLGFTDEVYYRRTYLFAP